MAKYDDSRRGKKQASRELKKGDTFYTKRKVARNLAPYEDSHLLHRHTVTGQHPLLGGAMVGGHAVEQIMNSEGSAYTDRNHPDVRGVRGVWEPAKQVAGPLDGKGKRILDKAELHGLAKQNRDAKAEQKKAGRRGWL